MIIYLRKVSATEALQFFKQSGGVRIENRVVYIQGELINHAIKKAPSNIEVFNKSGGHVFHMGTGQGHETHFGIGCTNTWFQNIEGNQVELFTRFC